MSVRALTVCRIVIGLVLACSLLHPPSAVAQAGDTTTREAAKHFQRGVALYGEADYRGALVEFKRAYALAPNPGALYDIGQTEYQLRDYAGALTTFERYLAESGPADSHRAEVASTVEVLRTRVGRLTITSVPASAEVSIDDQPVGKTPFDKPLTVSIGRRKLIASMAGRPPVTRYVDVAADDNVNVTLQLGASTGETPGARLEQQAASSGVASTPSRGTSTLRVAGFIATGALAAGAVTFGLLSLNKSHDLEAARGEYPTTSSALDHEARITTAYSILADSLAAAAVVVGGVTLFSMLRSSSPSSRATGVGPRVSLGLASARFETSF